MKNILDTILASTVRAVKGVWNFYYEGFRGMTIGKSLWVIILAKLFLFFVIIKLLFFPNILKRDFSTDEERANHVRQELYNR